MVVYEEMESARDARREMDGFVWVDEVGDGLDETVGVVQDGVEEEEAYVASSRLKDARARARAGRHVTGS